MSLFEIFGEAANPGNVGELTFGGGDPPERSKAVVAVRLFFALVLLGLWIWTLASPFGIVTLKWWAISGGLTLMYLVLAWHVRPEPDMDNMGWCGGLIDHPFRYSDDFNRSLLWLRILLWPGLFVAESLVDVPCLFRAADAPLRIKRRKVRRRRREPDRPDGNVFDPS